MAADAPDALSVVELQSLLEAGEAQPIDVRLPFDYYGGRVPGSLNLPGAPAAMVAGLFAPDRHLVLICDDGRSSRRAAEAICAAGFQRVSVLDGGFEAWLDAGLPTQTISDGVTPELGPPPQG